MCHFPSVNAVLNDLIWIVILFINIITGFGVRLLDVEIDFQNEDLDVEIYMEPPE